MDVILWIVQILLALLFGMAGFMKLTQPYEKLQGMMKWVESVPPTGVKVIGFLELTGAIGLLLPSLLRILPVLTPLAAGGLVLTMLGAMALHVQRKEFNVLPINLVLGGLALFVAVGRFAIVPLA
jgi:putative oxidoreductase